jgi:hypothetical protein
MDLDDLHANWTGISHGVAIFHKTNADNALKPCKSDLYKVCGLLAPALCSGGHVLAAQPSTCGRYLLHPGGHGNFCTVLPTTVTPPRQSYGLSSAAGLRRRNFPLHPRRPGQTLCSIVVHKT